jgi:hypothetical protein
MAEGLLSSIIGAGDYTELDSPFPIQNNTIMGVQTPLAAQIPTMESVKRSSCRFGHREYVRDIAMTTVFTINAFVIDPSNGILFPWLQTIAYQWQEWKLLGMVFEFRSLSANAVSAVAAGMGSVTMAVQYDVYADSPTGKMEMANWDFAVSCKPSESMFAPVECDPAVTPAAPLYMKDPTSISQGPDKHWYQFGTMYVATVGAPTPYPSCGELWVTYDVMFIKPRIYSQFQLVFVRKPADVLSVSETKEEDRENVGDGFCLTDPKTEREKEKEKDCSVVAHTANRGPPGYRPTVLHAYTR